MRNIVFGTILFLVTTFLSAFVYLYFFVDLTPVKFNSIHPNIEVVKNSSKFFDIYSNLILNVKNTDIRNVKPNVIGIFYTDKIRPDNKVMLDSYRQDLGSTISIVNENEALIYIYISDNIINSDNHNKIVKDYTIETIRYYQVLSKNSIDNIFLKLIKLPINVKDN